jgi:hypothetical protein
MVENLYYRRDTDYMHEMLIAALIGIVGFAGLCVILHFIIKNAVKDAVLAALIEFEKNKDNYKIDDEDNS